MAPGVIEGRRLDAVGSIMGLPAMAHSHGMPSGPLAAGIPVDIFSFRAIPVFGPSIPLAGTIVFVCLQPPAGGEAEEEGGEISGWSPGRNGNH